MSSHQLDFHLKKLDDLCIHIATRYPQALDLYKRGDSLRRKLLSADSRELEANCNLDELETLLREGMKMDGEEIMETITLS